MRTSKFSSVCLPAMSERRCESKSIVVCRIRREAEKHCFLSVGEMTGGECNAI